MRTRSGAKHLRGRGFYFFRDEALNANTFHNNLVGLKRTPLQEHNPGSTVSGPFSIPRIYRSRNRTFFFTSYELDKVLDTAVVDTLVPVNQNPLFPLPAPTNLRERRTENSSSALAATAEVAPFVEPVSTPLRNHIFTTRIDHQFSSTHNGALLYQMGRLANLRQFGGANRSGPGPDG